MIERRKILIVDDTSTNLQVLGGILEKAGYEVLVAMNGANALKIAATSPAPDLILLDILMPDLNGYEVCQRLKADASLKTIPVLFLSALDQIEQKVKGFKVGGADYITKPFQVEEVLARVDTHLQLKLHRDQLEELVAERTQDLVLIQDALLTGMAIIAEFSDQKTSRHSQRCKGFVQLLVANLDPEQVDELAPEDLKQIVHSVPLHDIGKVGIPEAILNKAGALTQTEIAQVRKHPQYGREIIHRTEALLGTQSFLRFAREMAESHHEKWDGSGYPQQLKGKAIPLSARMMALADTYDALVSKRPYREPMSCAEAFKVITQGDGRTSPEHFDPQLLKSFCKLREEFERLVNESLSD